MSKCSLSYKKFKSLGLWKARIVLNLCLFLITVLSVGCEKKLPFETIDESSGSSKHVKRADYVITNYNDWKYFNNIRTGSYFFHENTVYMGEKPPDLTIDFTKEMIIAVFQGRRPTTGYGIGRESRDRHLLNMEMVNLSFSLKG